MVNIEIMHLYISPGHNYFGHHQLPPGENEIIELPSIHCLAGRGVEGDRFCDYKVNYKGQITFFEWETYQSLSEECGVSNVPPSALRRNVVTRGAELNSLIGVTFEIQGIYFEGTSECSPCYWMNEAFHPEAESRLQGRGGLRARILSDGWLSRI